jgi:hypothetical protein
VSGGNGLLTVAEVVELTGYHKTSIYEGCQRYRRRIALEAMKGDPDIVAREGEVPNVKGAGGIRIVPANWPLLKVLGR